MTKGREHSGRLRGDHRRAVDGALGRGDRGGEIADVDGAAGDREQAVLGLFVEHRLLGADDRQHDRAPEIVAPGRLGDLALFARQHFLVVDLLDRQRIVSQVRADPRRSTQPAALRRIEGQQAQQGVEGLGRHAADEHQAGDVAIVEHPGRFGDAALAAVGRGAFDHQRVRRHADGDGDAER